MTLEDFDAQEKNNEGIVKRMLDLTKQYNKAVQEECKVDLDKLVVKNVGKLDPKKHLEQDVEQLMADNIVQTLGSMLDTIVF